MRMRRLLVEILIAAIFAVIVLGLLAAWILRAAPAVG